MSNGRRTVLKDIHIDIVLKVKYQYDSKSIGSDEPNVIQYLNHVVTGKTLLNAVEKLEKLIN